MPLRSLSTQTSFNTSTDLLLRDFIVPCLSSSTSYDRGVGYFTSNWLRLASEGLAALAANGGRCRIIASPKLEASDAAALLQGANAKASTALYRSIVLELEHLADALAKDTLAAMSWMVADGILDFRLALPTGLLDGDFHDKFGVFSDGVDSVAFRGSPNDSEQAFNNYESISAYYSWENAREASRVVNEQQRFDRIWNNADVNLRVFDFPEAARRNLIEFTSRLERPYPEPGRTITSGARWQHQQEAMSAFFNAKRGVLEMATGTGKTRTAIAILNELHQRGLIQSAIVTAYGTDLLDQWHAELLRRSEFPVYRHYDRYRDSLAYLNASANTVLLITRQNLVEILPKLPVVHKRRTLLVCDEVHGMGGAGLIRELDGRLSDFVYRLGLSATPERAYDDAGNAFIDQQIGPVIFRFPLEKAIERGILCKFEYVEMEYEFSDEDKASVRQAIRRHHARAKSPEPSPLENLYQELARIRKLSVEKLEPFRQLLKERPKILERSLIFVETAEYGALVQDILMDHGIDYHTYYGDDDRKNLKSFASGELQCLITCKRISEGIDIKSVYSVVLFASARAKLETVQRLGRCLRADPENLDKKARVIDFIRTDDFDPDETDAESTADMERRDWFRRLAYKTTTYPIDSVQE